MKREVKLYIVLTFAWSFVLWMGAIGLTIVEEGRLLQHVELIEALRNGLINKEMILPTVMSILAVYGPVIGLIGVVLHSKETRVSIKDYFAKGFTFALLTKVLLLFILVTGLPSLLHLVIHGVSDIPNKWLSLGITLLLFEIFTSALEEFGWRGFLLPKYLETKNPWQASLHTGLIWALWHTPIVIYIFYNQGMVLPQIVSSFVGFIAGIIAMSVVHTYFFIKSKSVWLSVVIHAVGNTIPFLFSFFTGESYIVALIVQLAMWMFVILLTRKEKKLFYTLQ